MPGSDPRQRIVVSLNQACASGSTPASTGYRPTAISPAASRRMRGSPAAQLCEPGFGAYKRQPGMRPPVPPARPVRRTGVPKGRVVRQAAAAGRTANQAGPRLERRDLLRPLALHARGVSVIHCRISEISQPTA